ncbi:unnamed protein product [Blepharisma stoltei]|uniref:RBR-type E3 ubiquitin transferase n=1 Tax=Blepharisma stoltei TaxID=1481888 RepID=A0AAU9J1R3_9CILI|nr:unnamed protein product [Blepharisma stoltei]
MDEISTNDDVHEELIAAKRLNHFKEKSDPKSSKKLRAREPRENASLKKSNQNSEISENEANFNGFLFKKPHLLPKIALNEKQPSEQNQKPKDILVKSHDSSIGHHKKVENKEEEKMIYLESTITSDSNAPSIRIFCSICFSTQLERVELVCNHTFCKKCILLLFENMINLGRVMPEEILCPNCNTMISDDFVNKHISQDQQTKINELRVNIKMLKLVAENKAVHCPVPDCKGFGYISPNDIHTACSACKAGICVVCKNGAHPGMTCEAYKSQFAEFKLDEMMLSRNWKRCPKCGAACMREDGCNYVICQSPICRGTQPFCNLCGKPLVQKQHFSHFLAQGPFGNICNTLDGTPEPPA